MAAAMPSSRIRLASPARGRMSILPIFIYRISAPKAPTDEAVKALWIGSQCQDLSLHSTEVLGTAGRRNQTSRARKPLTEIIYTQDHQFRSSAPARSDMRLICPDHAAPAPAMAFCGIVISGRASAGPRPNAYDAASRSGEWGLAGSLLPRSMGAATAIFSFRQRLWNGLKPRSADNVAQVDRESFAARRHLPRPPSPKPAPQGGYRSFLAPRHR